MLPLSSEESGDNQDGMDVLTDLRLCGSHILNQVFS